MTTFALPPAGVPGLSVLGPALGLWAFAQARDWRRGALYGLLWGLGFSGLLFRWTLELDPAAYLALGSVQALFWVVTGGVATVLAQRLSAVAWIPAVAATWTLVEAVRARWPLRGFEWGQLGWATAEWGVRRGAALVGTLGLTALTVALAASLVVWALRGFTLSSLRPALFTTVLIVGVVLVGHVNWTTPSGELDIAVVQIDDPCPGEFAANCPNLRARLIRRALAGTERLSGEQQLIFWGEGILRGDTLADAGADLVAANGPLPAPLLTGADTPGPPGRFYRWNALYSRDGELLGSYAKRQPVPFGEYVPFREILGGIGDVGRLVGNDMIPGSGPQLITLPTDDGPVRIGSVVSWEVSFSRLVRGSSIDSNFLTTLTTQASYGLTPVSDQLLGAAQLRSAELGKSTVVAATTGRSAIIDPQGERLETTGLFQADILEGTVPLRSGSTPFARWGDLPVLIFAVLILASGWIPGYARRQSVKPDHAPVI